MPDGIAAVVVAAGRGVRAGGNMPKQYRPIRGAPVIRHALSVFVDHPEIEFVQAVIHRDDAATFAEATAGLKLRAAVFGGTTRQISVRSGLEAIEKAQPRLVLVHDAARPFASPALISRAIAAGAGGAASPGMAAPPAPAAIAREIRAGEANGRAASCTSTRRGCAFSIASSPERTEIWRVVPPKTAARNFSPAVASAKVAASSRWMTACTNSISGWSTNTDKAWRITGAPRIGRYCLGILPPARTPRPAATTTAAIPSGIASSPSCAVSSLPRTQSRRT